ncbi:MAG: hypothetical protein RLY16_1381 [Bacteroidota bacterium]
MGIFSFFKRKPRKFFTPEENAMIVAAIQNSERLTSGEIRVFVESKNTYVNTLDRAREIFAQLKMFETQERNAVLLYIAVDHREVALFGDEGIHQRVGTAYWDAAVQQMIAYFSKHDLAKGIETCVLQIGATLQKEFPYQPTTDKNELPDDIVFGV